MANKLHELLAVEQDRKHKAVKAIGEANNTFNKKTPYFDGMLKRYIALEENAEQVPDETKEIVTTVKNKIDEVSAKVIEGIDAHLSKEETNASGVAKAELIVDGVNLGTFSATSLLALENHLGKIRDLYNGIPTLDPTYKWELDGQDNLYKTQPEVKFRSVKRPKVIVKYEATKEHPAQTELLYLDYQVGKYETVYSSGRIPVAQKRTLIERINNLIEAVKVARTKANNVDVNNVKIGQRLFDFINQGILSS